MKIILESKYKPGDFVYMEAYGIGTYNYVIILEVDKANDGLSFIYKIQAGKANTYHWIPEKYLYSDLSGLQEKWREQIKYPEKYD